MKFFFGKDRKTPIVAYLKKKITSDKKFFLVKKILLLGMIYGFSATVSIKFKSITSTKKVCFVMPGYSSFFYKKYNLKALYKTLFNNSTSSKL